MKKIIALIAASVLLVTSCASCAAVKPADETTASPDTTEDITVTVTFPEGTTIAEASKLLENNGVCSAADFINESKAPTAEYSFLNEITNKDERPFTAEGYVFPDTYEFYRGEGAPAAIKRFFDNYNSKITDELKARADELGYTMDEILTLASIIQEEASDAEMKKVSSVFHNRLNSGYTRLESDVTINYLNKYVKPYVDDVSVYSELYNTYKCAALPAGPITNPGLNAITAALYPDKTDYMFFVSDSDGNYHYAVTWSEHEKNVAEYVD